MNAEQRESFRIAVLRVLDANATAYGLVLGVLGPLMARFGFREVRATQLERELIYLQDKGYALSIDKAISPENRAWRITAAGRDYLAQFHGRG